MDRQELLAVFRAMVTARDIEHVEQELTARGEAFFCLSAAGHDAIAALAPHLTPQDWLHCHYRDRSLLLARGLPAKAFFDNLLCKHDSSSRGRQMSPFYSDPQLKILSMVTPTGNNALQAVGVAAAVQASEDRPLVYCGVGDGTTQQGEFLEAVAEAVRCHVPVLFVVQDNGLAISTHTRSRTFFSLPGGKAAELFGLPIQYLNGREVVDVGRAFAEIVAGMRADRGPRLVILEVERLGSHTNADDQRVYRAAEELERVALTGDPLQRLEQYLLSQGVPEQELLTVRAKAAQEVAAALAAATAGPEPTPVFDAKRKLPVELTHPSRERRGLRGVATVTMRDAMRAVLRAQLGGDPRVFLYGEDIEDPKGDVFGVTRGLSTEFAGRVCNSPLAESTIVGSCIGRALAGQRPVAFVQFADFLPVVHNQIASELATIFWRTDGSWQAPVVILSPCGAYRPGLGPFHAQTMDGTLVHTPGLDVVMPSTACDAAGLLNAAFQSQRPTLFLYPKALLNDPARATSPDVADQFVPIGVARKLRTGRDITLVGWGNTVALCERAAAVLETAGVECDVIDLRSLSPWDEQTVLASAEKTARLVVVHEDNHTCGLGGEIMATIAEKARLPVAMRRVTRPDTYVPFHFGNQLDVMPSFKRVLDTAADLLGFDLTWEKAPELDEHLVVVKAIGSAPSDETVILAELHVHVGDVVRAGDVLASVEASKSVFDISCPVDGYVQQLFAAEGETVVVGRPLAHIHVGQPVARRKSTMQEEPGEPVLVRRREAATLPLPRRSHRPRSFDVGISRVDGVTGSRIVTNQEILTATAGMTDEDVVRLTGIHSRHWIGGRETAVSLGVQAAERLFEREGLTVDDISLLICSTTSPLSVTPSTACQVLNGLANGHTAPMIQAYDINAACSGYLYALQAGYDYLQSTPDGRVLVVTTEVLSPLINPDDLDTAILFGDAASATILYGEEHFARCKGK
ncbi:MAG: thiamine pyrophosphate-dependent enzyme, partial [Pirellulaceae bacterium]